MPCPAQHAPGSVVCAASGLALFIASDDSGGAVAKRLPFLSVPELTLRMTASTLEPAGGSLGTATPAGTSFSAIVYGGVSPVFCFCLAALY